MRLHHFQVACSPSTENAARRFYEVGLGLTQVQKPDDLKPADLVWLRAFGESAALTTRPGSQFASVAVPEGDTERLVEKRLDVDWNDVFTAVAVADRAPHRVTDEQRS